MDYVQNPITLRMIKVGGPTYNKLMREGYKMGGKKRMQKKTPSLDATLKTLPASRKAKTAQLKKVMKNQSEGRGSRTRGWAAAAPQRGKERQDLFKRCGAKCFLKPGDLGFPVCLPLRESKGCNVDCRGITAAKVRAGQYHYPIISQNPR